MTVLPRALGVVLLLALALAPARPAGAATPKQVDIANAAVPVGLSP